MNALVIVAGPADPTGPADAADRAASGMELALELARSEGVSVRVYLLGGSVELARSAPADAEPSAARQVRRLVGGGVEVAVNELDLRSRGLDPEDLVIGAEPTPGPALAA